MVNSIVTWTDEHLSLQFPLPKLTMGCTKSRPAYAPPTQQPAVVVGPRKPVRPPGQDFFILDSDANPTPRLHAPPAASHRPQQQQQQQQYQYQQQQHQQQQDEFVLDRETLSILAQVLDSDKHVTMVAIPYENLQLQETIGLGVYGEVIKASYHSTPVVVKRMPRTAINERSIRIFREEIELMMHLRHPNIVQFIGASWSSPTNICFVMEHLQRGDLYAMLRNPKYNLAWNKKLLQIAIHAARGMAYLHSMDPPIIHRDLKSMNIHVSSSYVAKISDFALSRERSVEETMSITGTPLWMAPEMIRGERYSEKADVYSFGIVLSELDTKQTPYNELTSKKKSTDKVTGVSVLMRRVAFEGLRPRLAEDGLSSVQELFTRCVDSTPSARPTFEEIIEFLEYNVQHEVNLRFPRGASYND
ncbi:unnamed protein product [Aphanomyces euteiches]